MEGRQGQLRGGGEETPRENQKYQPGKWWYNNLEKISASKTWIQFFLKISVRKNCIQYFRKNISLENLDTIQKKIYRIFNLPIFEYNIFEKILYNFVECNVKQWQINTANAYFVELGKDFCDLC